MRELDWLARSFNHDTLGRLTREERGLGLECNNESDKVEKGQKLDGELRMAAGVEDRTRKRRFGPAFK